MIIVADNESSSWSAVIVGNDGSYIMRKFVDDLFESSKVLPSYINITSDINLIKEFYSSLGYYFVKIETEIARLDKNRVNISYLIDKGKKAKIAKIYFLGEKKVKERRLRNIITSQENKFWKIISIKNMYI